MAYHIWHPSHTRLMALRRPPPAAIPTKLSALDFQRALVLCVDWDYEAGAGSFEIWCAPVSINIVDHGLGHLVKQPLEEV